MYNNINHTHVFLPRRRRHLDWSFYWIRVSIKSYKIQDYIKSYQMPVFSNHIKYELLSNHIKYKFILNHIKCEELFLPRRRRHLYWKHPYPINRRHPYPPAVKDHNKIKNIRMGHVFHSKSGPYMRALDTPIRANCTESTSGPYGTSPGA